MRAFVHELLEPGAARMRGKIVLQALQGDSSSDDPR